MKDSIAIYYRKHSSQTGTYQELLNDLRQSVEDSGRAVVATYVDDDTLIGRGRNAGWKALLANLDGIDLVVVRTAGDLPGRSVKDLLATLGHLRERGVGLYLVTEGIDTGSGTAFSMLDIIAAYRRAKVSAAIRAGQQRAVAAGKKLGRPEVPASVRQRIQAALASGAGIRPTARRFGCSPGTVINLRRSMAEISAQAA